MASCEPLVRFLYTYWVTKSGGQYCAEGPDNSFIAVASGRYYGGSSILGYIAGLIVESRGLVHVNHVTSVSVSSASSGP